MTTPSADSTWRDAIRIDYTGGRVYVTRRMKKESPRQAARPYARGATRTMLESDHRTAVRQAVFGLAGCTLFFAAAVSAMPVGNFALADQSGANHELFDGGDAKVVVLMVQGNGCPVVHNALIDLNAVRERFRGEPVRFLMINSNLQDDEVSIRAEAQEWGIDLPVLVDDTQEVGEALRFTRTAEALVIDTQSRSLAYRGPINDRLVYERQRRQADNHYVIDAVEAVLAGERPAVKSIAAVGCLIHFPERGDRSVPREAHHH